MPKRYQVVSTYGREYSAPFQLLRRQPCHLLLHRRSSHLLRRQLRYPTNNILYGVMLCCVTLCCLCHCYMIPWYCLGTFSSVVQPPESGSIKRDESVDNLQYSSTRVGQSPRTEYLTSTQQQSTREGTGLNVLYYGLNAGFDRTRIVVTRNSGHIIRSEHYGNYYHSGHTCIDRAADIPQSKHAPPNDTQSQCHGGNYSTASCDSILENGM